MPRRSPKPFFADIGDEGDGAGRFDVAFVQGADDREHHRQAAAIVADARAFEELPSRVTLTLVPSGNTVSRWAANTRFGMRAPCRAGRRSRCRPCRCAHRAVRGL